MSKITDIAVSSMSMQKIKDSCLWLKQLWFDWKTLCVFRRVSCIAKGPYTLQLKLQQFCLIDRCENRCPYIKLEKNEKCCSCEKSCSAVPFAVLVRRADTFFNAGMLTYNRLIIAIIECVQNHSGISSSSCQPIDLLLI